jgi:hypothetical protein
MAEEARIVDLDHPIDVKVRTHKASFGEAARLRVDALDPGITEVWFRTGPGNASLG